MNAGVSDDPVPPPTDPSVEALHASIGRFVTAFERSSRRWELVVYPALLAFVILAAYGFFLIYSLTGDMRSMAANMDTMSRDMHGLSIHVQHMAERVDDMSHTVADMSEKMDALEPMVASMNDMRDSIQTLSVTNDLMRHDVAVMSHNISRPMNAMGRVMPW